ncbi:MAG: HNH endonuclease [Bdellovibrio sp.]
MDQQLYSFEEKVNTLNDQNLVEQVRQLFHREKRLGDAILLGLKEIKERRIYAAMGYSNLFEMLVKFYHLSETASYQRVNALKLIDSVPEAQTALFNGEVSLSNAALVQSFIQRSEKDSQIRMSSTEKLDLIETIKGKTHKEAQVALAEINPIAVLPANKEKPLSKSHSQLQIVVDHETMALLKEVQELLSHTIPDGDYNAILKYMGIQMIEILRQKKGFNPQKLKKNWNENIKKCDIRSTSTSTNTTANTTANADATACVSESECTSTVKQTNANVVNNTSASAVKQTDIKIITGAISRTNVSMCKNSKVGFNKFEKSESKSALSNSTLLNTAIHEDKINKTTDASKHCAQGRYISRHVKRTIFERADGQCEFISTDGHRCESHHLLEIDHIIPWSFGGGNNQENCRLLCRTHNNYRTKETHGYWYKTNVQDG